MNLQEVTGTLAARDAWSRAELEEHQRAKLRELVEHAVSSSAYYREALGPDAMDRPLSDLPILTKTTMMENFDALVTDPRLRLADVEAHLGGPDPAADFAGEYALMTTSGTTGARGVFAYSREEMWMSLAGTLNGLRRLGAEPGMRIIGIGSPSPLFKSRRIFALLPAGEVTPPALSVATPLPELVAALNDFQPEGLIGYPTLFAVLAEEQDAGRLRIAPRFMGTGSEVQTEDQVKRIEGAFGVRPGNAYVTTEACPIAIACDKHVGLHVAEDLLVLEVVDADGNAVPAGVPGRVLVTNLVKRGQPLIRYEITDSVVMAEGENPTGMPWRRVASIDGRINEIVTLAGEDGDEVAVHPHHLREPFATLDDVVQYQFEYDGRDLGVLVVPRPEANRDLEERVRLALLDALESAGAGGTRLDVRVVESIEREPGGAAKLKQLKRVERVGA